MFEIRYKEAKTNIEVTEFVNTENLIETLKLYDARQIKIYYNDKRVYKYQLHPALSK